MRVLRNPECTGDRAAAARERVAGAGERERRVRPRVSDCACAGGLQRAYIAPRRGVSRARAPPPGTMAAQPAPRPGPHPGQPRRVPAAARARLVTGLEVSGLIAPLSEALPAPMRAPRRAPTDFLLFSAERAPLQRRPAVDSRPGNSWVFLGPVLGGARAAQDFIGWQRSRRGVTRSWTGVGGARSWV